MFAAGGSDPLHYTLAFIQFLKETAVKSCFRYHFLIGSLNPDISKIMDLTSSMPDINLHINCNNVRKLMDSCDIAVSATGTIMYELCACGVPTISYVVADNQIKAAKQFEKMGLCVGCGDISTFANPPLKLYEEINKLANDYSKRSLMSTSMQRTVNGYGADKLANLLINLREE